MSKNTNVVAGHEAVVAILKEAGVEIPRLRANSSSQTMNFPAEGGTITRNDRALIGKLNTALSNGRGNLPKGVVTHNFFWDGKPSTITISFPL